MVDAVTGKHIAGVQVKPDTYRGHEYNDNWNTKQNAKYSREYGAQVLYLFYNHERKAWNNYDALLAGLKPVTD